MIIPEDLKMPLNPTAMKAAFQATIQAGLQRVFEAEVSQATGYAPISQEHWAKIADAVSDIAMDIVTQITTNAEVLPGIPVATTGSAMAQTGATTAPGQIQ
jgi:hypothetical protein